jgi:hypothetical protein
MQNRGKDDKPMMPQGKRPSPPPGPPAKGKRLKAIIDGSSSTKDWRIVDSVTGEEIAGVSEIKIIGKASSRPYVEIKLICFDFDFVKKDPS